MLVEGVGGELIFTAVQLKIVAIDKPQQVALAAAMRAIAFDDLCQLAFHAEFHLAAMAASLVFHVRFLFCRHE